MSPIAVTLAAGVSGAFAAAASHPFDTTRSRSQCTVLPKVWSNVSSRSKFHFLVQNAFVFFNASLALNFSLFIPIWHYAHNLIFLNVNMLRFSCLFLPQFHLQYVSMERKFLKWSTRPGNRFERLTGINPADRKLLRNGMWLRMGRCGFTSSVIVGTYFLAIDHLVSN